MKSNQTLTNGIRKIVAWITALSYVQLGGAYGCMVILFGCAYFGIFVISPDNAPNLGGGPPWIKLLNGIYFSIITAASVGYGDITPHGLSKILAGFESITSLFVFAILVSKPTSERQEAALYQMHKLTLDEIFTSIREGFFLMRKDFDSIIDEAESSNTLSEHGKDNFETALQHGAVLIEDIPAFYDIDQKLYVIDIRREKLLAEAVERTFERLTKTTGVLTAKKIPLSERTRKILAGLGNVGTEILKQWRRHSSKEIHPSIDQTIELLKEIRKNGL
jgi:hypothetical protein